MSESMHSIVFDWQNRLKMPRPDAYRLGAMVMTRPHRHRPAQHMANEALTQQGGLLPGATPAVPVRSRRCGRGGRRSLGLCVGHRGVGALVGWGVGRCACAQWSKDHRCKPTLVRHVLVSTTGLAGDLAIPASSAARTPAPRSLGMGKATTPRTLVAACGRASSHIACLVPASPAAVTVAAVATAAKHHLHAAHRAKKHAGWTVHTHPGRTEGAGRIRPSEPHSRGTAFIGTV